MEPIGALAGDRAAFLRGVCRSARCERRAVKTPHRVALHGGASRRAAAPDAPGNAAASGARSARAAADAGAVDAALGAEASGHAGARDAARGSCAAPPLPTRQATPWSEGSSDAEPLAELAELLEECKLEGSISVERQRALAAALLRGLDGGPDGAIEARMRCELVRDVLKALTAANEELAEELLAARETLAARGRAPTPRARLGAGRRVSAAVARLRQRHRRRKAEPGDGARAARIRAPHPRVLRRVAAGEGRAAFAARRRHRRRRRRRRVAAARDAAEATAAARARRRRARRPRVPERCRARRGAAGHDAPALLRLLSRLTKPSALAALGAEHCADVRQLRRELAAFAERDGRAIPTAALQAPAAAAAAAARGGRASSRRSTAWAISRNGCTRRTASRRRRRSSAAASTNSTPRTSTPRAATRRPTSFSTPSGCEKYGM